MEEFSVSNVKFVYIHPMTLGEAIEIARETSDFDKCTVLFLWNGELVTIPYGHDVSEKDIMARIVRKNAVMSYE